MSDDLGRWEAITVAEVARLFRGAVFPWWIAGGHAIELAVGQELREHDDLDVLVLSVTKPSSASIWPAGICMLPTRLVLVGFGRGAPASISNSR